jgi:hypothetical protein
MITMQEPYARAREAQIRHHLSRRLSRRPTIEQQARPPTLRVRIGLGLIDAGRALVGDHEPGLREAA